MHPVKVNLLHTSPIPQAPVPPKPPKSPFRRFITFFIGLFIAAFVFGRLSLTMPALSAIGSITDLAIISQFRHLVGAPDKLLKGESDDRINILLLGMGGENHEGPNLTDTVILASIKPSTNDVAMLSIPRDLIIPLDNHGWRKINSINAFGEEADRGAGADYTRKTLANVLGVEIPYVVRIDFNGFKSIVEAVGGVDIYVDRSFSDPTYPTNNYLTQTVSFKKGWMHMDGSTALIFSRSRHGNNGEGTDFARAKRQQKILVAIKNKLTTLSTYRNPTTITNTLASLRANITTNMQIGELVRFAKMAQTMENPTIRQKVLDNSKESPFVDSTLYGAYVLVPRNDDWTPLREIAENIFTVAPVSNANPTNEPAPTTVTQTPPKTKSKIEIQNGTTREGYARTIANTLTGSGFEIVKIGNAESQTHPKTIIEDYTGNTTSESIAQLQQAIAKATNLDNLPQIVKKLGNSSSRTTNADYLIILGSDGS
jgi:LCP family protein required for cell wall assembly